MSAPDSQIESGRCKWMAVDGGWLLFHPEDLTLQRLSSDGTVVQRIATDHLSRVLRPRGREGAPLPHVARDEDPRPFLRRLTLCISNACNLRCSYCYANAGAYYQGAGLLMSASTALHALNWASRAYRGIGHISFFGGEPTLNPKVVALVCDYARFLYRRGVLTAVPSLGITTNGYAMSRDVLNLIVRQGLSTTVSLDGPKIIHDANRPTRDGRGSYDAAVANIRLLAGSGVPLEFECTYTMNHLRSGIVITDLMDFFHNEFGCKTLHCPIVSLAPDSLDLIPLEIAEHLQCDAIDYSMENLSLGVPKALSTSVRLLTALSSATPIWHYCPAATSEITVNADGGVYACFMLMNSPLASVGSVNRVWKAHHAGSQPATRPESGPGHAIEYTHKLVETMDKYCNPACRECWAQPLCHGCFGEDVVRFGECFGRSAQDGESAICDHSRTLVERFLSAVGRVSPAPMAGCGGDGECQPIPCQE